MNMIRVGIVAEGPSDWIILEEVMTTVHADLEFQHIQPDQTLASRRPFGWRGVKAWCEEFGPKLESFMTGITPRLDLLVIHVDCSMADKIGLERPCPPPSATADGLKTEITTGWLGRSSRPEFVVLVTPSKSTDAWVVASLNPPYSRLANVECEHGVEDELVKRKRLRRRDGQIKKPAHKYIQFAAELRSAFERVCRHCTQASLFRSEFTIAVSHIPYGL
jgi:hypothetical protein